MKTLNIIVEGSTEEAFVNDVLQAYLSQFEIYVYCRKILTGWDSINNKPAKGGLLKYIKFRNDVIRWIEEDRGRKDTYYSSFIDLYAFPKDDQSPYTKAIQKITDPYVKIITLEKAIKENINHPNFIPYVQLHEFETFLLTSPDNISVMYPDKTTGINRLKKEITGIDVELINETPQNAPSKRIIKYIPEYEGQKAQIGPLVAEDIGLDILRAGCRHFNEWLNFIEKL